jgi:predicted dehydrogenase
VQLKGSKMSDVIKETTIVRWIILDCGNVTEKKVVHLIQNSRIHRAVMTGTAKKRKNYANRHGIKYYTDAFINDPDIDATYEAFKIKKFPCL